VNLRLVDATDEERWAQAESILVERPTEAAQSRLRRRRTMLWLLVVAVTVVSLGLGVLLVVVLGGSGDLNPSHPPTWQVVLGVVVSGTGMVVDVVGLVILVRRRRWGQAWRAPTAVLSRTQQRSLLAQIRGRRPVDPARLPLARDLAERLSDQRGTAALVVGIVLINLGNTLITPSAFRLWITAVVLVAYAIGAALLVRQVRRMRRFLDAHPEETLDR
jgi:protein-S-isoprenylcysteine O-methyltransferase Ste14